MHDDRYPEELYQRSLAYYSAHQPITWPQAQEAVQKLEAREQQQYAAAQACEHYDRESESLTEDQQFDAAVNYQRSHPYASFEESAELHGMGLVDVPARLNASGLVDDSPPQHYARAKTRRGTLDAEALRQLTTDLECTEAEAERYWAECMRLVREGKSWDTAQARAMALAFGSSSSERQAGITEMDSHPTAPTTTRGQTSELDSGFIRRGNTAAFKDGDRAPRRPQGIPAPEPGGLTPQGYQREPEDLSERDLDQILAHMRQHNCSYEQAKGHFADAKRKKLAKALGVRGPRQGPPEGAPIGHPLQQQFARNLRPCADGGWIEDAPCA
jgi:hypothetical protein